MAQKTIIHLVDDLEGGEADETVVFGLDRWQYEIDLTKEHADELREALEPYVAVARRFSGAASAPPTGGGRRKNLADVRAWANENGFTVSDRGRIPTNVVEAYDAVH